MFPKSRFGRQVWARSSPKKERSFAWATRVPEQGPRRDCGL